MLLRQNQTLDTSIVLYDEPGGTWIRSYLFIAVRCCAVPNCFTNCNFLLFELYSSIVPSFYIRWLALNQVSFKLHDLFKTSIPTPVSPVASSREQTPSVFPVPSTHPHV
jgi:hypothetical protein